MTVPNPAQERAYPLPRPADDRDPRFTFGLIRDVAKVLAEHGYPPVDNGIDHVWLQQALFGFIYAPAAATGHSEAAKLVERTAIQWGNRPTSEWFCVGAEAGSVPRCGQPGPHGEHVIGDPEGLPEFGHRLDDCRECEHPRWNPDNGQCFECGGGAR